MTYDTNVNRKVTNIDQGEREYYKAKAHVGFITLFVGTAGTTAR